jgi:hypothetical protein
LKKRDLGSRSPLQYRIVWMWLAHGYFCNGRKIYLKGQVF